MIVKAKSVQITAVRPPANQQKTLRKRIDTVASYLDTSKNNNSEKSVKHGQRVSQT